MLDRSQHDIVSDWPVDVQPLVSICCVAFNHEDYIRQAMDSFLMQKTTFPFEILVHDDASTDRTASIIKEYEEMYPDIVRPIYQTENQFKKNPLINFRFNFPRAKGKYLAICEGDDYWIHSEKLQLQVTAMENHPELDFSFHSAYCLTGAGRDKKPSWDYGEDRVFYPDSIINCPDSFAPTSSYIVNTKLMNNLPAWFYEKAPVGDLFIELYGAKRGGCLYINLPMSIYRTGVGSSWTTIVSDHNARIKHIQKLLITLQLMKNDFPEYFDAFNRKESVCYFRMAMCGLRLKNDVEFKEKIRKSVELFSFFSHKQRIVYLLRYMPFILRFIDRFQR